MKEFTSEEQNHHQEQKKVYTIRSCLFFWPHPLPLSLLSGTHFLPLPQSTTDLEKHPPGKVKLCDIHSSTYPSKDSFLREGLSNTPSQRQGQWAHQNRGGHPMPVLVNLSISMSQMHHFKGPDSHIFNRNEWFLIFYLNQSSKMLSRCNQYKNVLIRFLWLFVSKSSKCGISHWGVATFQFLNSHMGLVTAVLDSTTL